MDSSGASGKSSTLGDSQGEPVEPWVGYTRLGSLEEVAFDFHVGKKQAFQVEGASGH